MNAIEIEEAVTPLELALFQSAADKSKSNKK